jgi:hypothetical protein
LRLCVFASNRVESYFEGLGLDVQSGSMIPFHPTRMALSRSFVRGKIKHNEAFKASSKVDWQKYEKYLNK